MTTTPDPILTSAREVLRRSRDEMRDAVKGLPADALNWRPVPDDTNSIAVLAVHSLSSTRMWLSIAVGESPPDRDRASEFAVSAGDSAELLSSVGRLTEACLSLVDDSRTVDWSALRDAQGPPGSGEDTQVFAAWALLHALEHLREHVGQISLTRQLWDQHSRSP